MRSDAKRNREAILSAAIGVLADTPTASMREIADASGAGRTTVYRHFPDRPALVAAIYARIFGDVEQLMLDAVRAPGAELRPIATVVDLSVELAGLGDRYRFLEQAAPDQTVTEPDDLQHRTGFRAFVEAARDRGAITADVDLDWLLEVLSALIMVAARTSSPEPLRRTLERVLAP